MIKNVHHSTDVSFITEELLKSGHKCRNIVNAKSKFTKQPMSIFFANIEIANNNKDVFNITRLCNAVVKIEAPHKFNDLVQCHRCQEFGHTQRYCRKPFRCVKCGDQHSTADCRKKLDSPPVCAHCQGNHTASYKGCEWYKKQLQLRMKEKSHNKANAKEIVYNPITSRTASVMSYADVVRDTHIGSNIESNMEDNIPLNQFKRLEDLIIKQMEASAKQQEQSRKLVEQLSAQVTQLLGVITAITPQLCN